MSGTYTLKWTTNAKDDLLNIVAYIKQDSTDIANDISKKIREKAHSRNFFSFKRQSRF